MPSPAFAPTAADLTALPPDLPAIHAAQVTAFLAETEDDIPDFDDEDIEDGEESVDEAEEDSAESHDEEGEDDQDCEGTEAA